jgi:hypothetical protein
MRNVYYDTLKLLNILGHARKREMEALSKHGLSNGYFILVHGIFDIYISLCE